jgi:phosphoadenosine phosphosulfate reductase
MFPGNIKSIKKHIRFIFLKQRSKSIESKGPNSFYESVENRKECCFIRKVAPLTKALKGILFGLQDLRAEQSENNDLHF